MSRPVDREQLRRFATRGVVFSALGIGGALVVAGTLWLFWFAPPGSLSEAPESALTIIPGPSSTPLPPTATLIPTSTATPTFAPLSPGEFGIGSYVQITGTQGDGLNIRTQPGLSSEVDFLGYDAEVFEVRDGPMEVDGFTWWYLVTPVDEARNGWAAAAYLSVVDNP